MAKINISGLPKAKVLMALYNGSKVQGMGIFQATGKDMTEHEAEDIVSEQMYFDYLHGKVMKVDISGDELETWLYDRDNGDGKAERLIDAIR